MTANERAVKKCAIIDKMVTALCSQIHKKGVYISKAPNFDNLPYSTFSIEQVEEMSDKCGLYGVRVTVQFDFFDTELKDIDLGSIVMGNDVEDDTGVFIVSEHQFADMAVEKLDTNVYNKTIVIIYNLQYIGG